MDKELGKNQFIRLSLEVGRPLRGCNRGSIAHNMRPIAHCNLAAQPHSLQVLLPRELRAPLQREPVEVHHPTVVAVAVHIVGVARTAVAGPFAHSTRPTALNSRAVRLLPLLLAALTRKM